MVTLILAILLIVLGFTQPLATYARCTIKLSSSFKQDTTLINLYFTQSLLYLEHNRLLETFPLFAREWMVFPQAAAQARGNTSTEY